MVRYIPVKGTIDAIVDDDDYERIAYFHWRLHQLPFHKTEYASTNRRINGKPTTLYMHRLVIQAPPRVIVDHIDMNGLNNIRANLRFVTGSQNQMNAGKRNDSFSQYKGVTYNPKRQKWLARITENGRQKYLGRYELETEAALAYNSAAQRLYGEYARVNEIPND